MPTRKLYGLAHQSALSGEVNLLSDTIRIMLVTSAYTFNYEGAGIAAGVPAGTVATPSRRTVAAPPSYTAGPVVAGGNWRGTAHVE